MDKIAVDPAKPSSKIWKAAHSYNSEGAPGQLSIVVGEEYEEVTPASNGWVVVKSKNGEEGSVPTKHLGIYYTSNYLSL